MFNVTANEYRVYAKTWIDGGDGEMFWKRAVMMHASSTFTPGSWRSNHQDLCVYPDDLDVGHDPVASAPYLPGGGENHRFVIILYSVRYICVRWLNVLLLLRFNWTLESRT